MARYFSRSRLDGTPAQARTVTHVNGKRLPDEAAYCHATPEGLLKDDVLLSLAANPDAKSELPTWCVVEFEAGDSSVVTPSAKEHLAGVFAVPLAEIGRTPLAEWVDHYAQHGTSVQQDAAKMLETLMDMALRRR
ncbi:MAG TPA: hypothetical protein RMH99_29325 [Sandaracinaceae bacterium LLY-WYZ-13_1]|nr:hypothetical protein [Sandaracinaceae bacterium LLY-WYZ-13_1]